MSREHYFWIRRCRCSNECFLMFQFVNELFLSNFLLIFHCSNDRFSCLDYLSKEKVFSFLSKYFFCFDDQPWIEMFNLLEERFHLIFNRLQHMHGGKANIIGEKVFFIQTLDGSFNLCDQGFVFGCFIFTENKHRDDDRMSRRELHENILT